MTTDTKTLIEKATIWQPMDAAPREQGQWLIAKNRKGMPMMITWEPVMGMFQREGGGYIPADQLVAFVYFVAEI